MGTRGYTVVRYKGIYFIRYNHYDSYPSGLGEQILSAIPVDPARFQIWLKKMIARHDSEYKKFYTPDGVIRPQFKQQDEDGDYFTSSSPAQNDLFIEWTYTVDLDQLIFSVDSLAHFRLESIPRDRAWIGYLAIDRSGRRCLLPDTPQEVVGLNLCPKPTLLDEYRNSFQSTATKSMLTLVPIDGWLPAASADDSKCAPSEVLAVELAEYMILFNYSTFSTLSSLPPAHAGFRSSALGILTVLAPAFFPLAEATHTEEFSKEKWTHHMEIAKSIKSFAATMPVDNETTPYAWVRDTLVIFATHLDDEHIREGYLGFAIQHASAPDRKAKALLFSVAHVVLVRIQADGIVEHSPLLPFITYGSEAADQERHTTLTAIARFLTPLMPTLSDSESRTRLPLDVLEHIMLFATTDLYQMFGRLSKHFYYRLISHPRVGKYTVTHGVGDSFPAKFNAFEGERSDAVENVRIHAATVSTTSMQRTSRPSDWVARWESRILPKEEVAHEAPADAKAMRAQLFESEVAY